MSKRFDKFKIILTYSIFVIVIFVTYIIHKNNIYNKLVVIDDKEKTMQLIDASIPVKINLHSNRWGNIEIKDSIVLKELWEIISQIPKSKNSYETKIKSYYDKITGTILYLDGKKKSLHIDSRLKIDDWYYGKENDSAYINRVRNYIDDVFCNPHILSLMINDRNKISVIDKYGNIIKCGSNDKLAIKNTVRDFEKISDTVLLQKAIKEKGNVNYHIRICIPKDTERKLSYREDYDIINIDVYENQYIVIKDYGNEIVNTFYMKGDLNYICENIFQSIR